MKEDRKKKILPNNNWNRNEDHTCPLSQGPTSILWIQG